MVKSGVLPNNGLYQWFNQTIYYFYVPLFFVFGVTPTLRNRNHIIAVIGIAVLAKSLSMSGKDTGIYAINTVLAYEIWFVLGMGIAFSSLDKKYRNEKVWWQGDCCL